MPSRNNNGNGRQRELDWEIEQYREAATSALGQLEWPQIARTLDRNRKQILRDIAARR
jgi:hypothetical protein